MEVSLRPLNRACHVISDCSSNCLLLRFQAVVPVAVFPAMASRRSESLHHPPPLAQRHMRILRPVDETLERCSTSGVT